MKFITRCLQCGDQNEIGGDERSSIQVYFARGNPGHDKMIICCENCGNRHEVVIVWPLPTIGD